MAIRLVTFDLDNTLWDINHVMREAERVTRAWFDTHVPEVNRQLGPEDLMAIRQRLVADHPALNHDLSALRERVFATAIRRVGYKPADARRLGAEAFRVFLEARHQVEYFEGALDVLTDLAGRYALAALSNGNADIVRLGLDRFFEFAYSAAHVGVGKPAPAMFEAALAHAGADAAEAVHVGDHPVDDIAGAHGVGITTIWVNLKAAEYPEDEQRAHAEVTHLTEIPERLKELDS